MEDLDSKNRLEGLARDERDMKGWYCKEEKEGKVYFYNNIPSFVCEFYLQEFVDLMVCDIQIHPKSIVTLGYLKVSGSIKQNYSWN